MSCSSQLPLAVHVRQSSGWSEMYSSITPRRRSARAGDWVLTFIPASAGVVHDAGKPRRPSISTTHRRQEPNGSTESVAHSLGTFTPAIIAARITLVPAGTVTAAPLISRVTLAAVALWGVP